MIGIGAPVWRSGPRSHQHHTIGHHGHQLFWRIFFPKCLVLDCCVIGLALTSTSYKCFHGFCVAFLQSLGVSDWDKEGTALLPHHDTHHSLFTEYFRLKTHLLALKIKRFGVAFEVQILYSIKSCALKSTFSTFYWSITEKFCIYSLKLLIYSLLTVFLW